MAVAPGVFRSRPGGGGTVLILDRAKIEAFNLPGGMTYRYGRGLAREVELYAHDSLYVGHGVKTGDLQRSIGSSVTPVGHGIVANVRATADHAIYYHEGTLPHRIYPRSPTGKLVFFWEKIGKLVAFPNSYTVTAEDGTVRRYGNPKRYVNHPGFHGHPFLREAMDEALARRGIT